MAETRKKICVCKYWLLILHNCGRNVFSFYSHREHNLQYYTVLITRTFLLQWESSITGTSHSSTAIITNKRQSKVSVKLILAFFHPISCFDNENENGGCGGGGGGFYYFYSFVGRIISKDALRLVAVEGYLLKSCLMGWKRGELKPLRSPSYA